MKKLFLVLCFLVIPGLCISGMIIQKFTSVGGVSTDIVVLESTDNITMESTDLMTF